MSFARNLFPEAMIYQRRHCFGIERTKNKCHNEKLNAPHMYCLDNQINLVLQNVAEQGLKLYYICSRKYKVCSNKFRSVLVNIFN